VYQPELELGISHLVVIRVTAGTLLLGGVIVGTSSRDDGVPEEAVAACYTMTL
jgi:hypothetical protein